MIKWICDNCRHEKTLDRLPCHYENETGIGPLHCPLFNDRMPQWRQEQRPADLPIWCMVGAWCYCLDDDGNGKYFQITKIDDRFIYGDNWDIDYHFTKPARLRPWTFEEAPEITKIKTETGCTLIATIVSNGGEWGYRLAHPGGMGDIVSFDYIAKNYIQLDGKPCCKLEHLNDNGEWVE